MVNLEIIRDLAKAKNIPLKELAEKSGITPQGLHKIIKGGSTKVDTLEKIADALGVKWIEFYTPSCNTVYVDEKNNARPNEIMVSAVISTETGEIIETDSPNFFLRHGIAVPGKTQPEPKPKGVPYYNVDFAAGFPEVENDQTSVPSGTVTMPGFSEADCLVNVTGGSMEPLISSGDAVALRRISGPDSILYGEVYAIVTDEYRTIKRVRRSDVPGRIRLVPENPDYDPQDIEVSGILHIYKVLGSVKLF